METKIKNFNLLIVIAIIAFMFVPMIYSLVYLGSVWDVYNNLDEVPVAFVNLDKPVIKDSKEISIGKNLENTLKENKKLGWKFVNHEDAIKGVEGTKYYALVEIPKDFSSNIANISDGQFSNPEIIFTINRGKNYIFSQISTNVANSIKSEVSSNIQKEISKSLVDNMYNIKISINDASNGANDLNTGSKKLADGGVSLSNGINEASNGSTLLANGLKDASKAEKQISDGTSSILTGLETFKANLIKPNPQITLLIEGATKASTGATSMYESSKTLKETMTLEFTNAADGIKRTAESIDNLSSILSSELENIKASNLSQEDKTKLITAITIASELKKSDLKTNLESPIRNAPSSFTPLVNNLKNLSDGTTLVTTGVNTLASALVTSQTNASVGLDKLITGAKNLQTGSTKLSTGLETISTKSTELSSGLQKINSGSKDLKDGLSTLNEGTEKLKDGLNTGSTKLNNNLNFSPEKMSDYISKPIELKTTTLNDVKHYGEGLAPYFISLSLWLGAMLMSVLLCTFRKNFKNKFLSSFWGLLLFGCALVSIESIMLSFSLKIVLGISSATNIMFYISNIIISIVFFCVAYGISNSTGIFSSPIMFLMLLFQLSSSGGTFPVNTAPTFYSVIGKLLPMTYSVNILRMAITNINTEIFMNNLEILTLFLIIFLSFSYIVTKAKFKINEKQVKANSIKLDFVN